MPEIRFNEIKDAITRANESKLMTRLEKRNISLKNAEKLLEDVISGKINNKKAKNMYNNIAENVNKLNKLKSISLAHLKAGNNSEELKNEIRQLLYSLYRSKNLTKTIYNSLMNAI